MAAKTNTYTCMRRVLHNGKRYLPTDAMQLSDVHASPLLALAAIRARPSRQKSPEKDPGLDQPAAKTVAQK
jgi:hypothetical protein